MTKSHAKRFVSSAWMLLSFQLIASAGAVGVTGLAAVHVSELAHDLEARQTPVAPEPASEHASDGSVVDPRTAARDDGGQNAVADEVTSTAPSIVQCVRSDGVIRVQGDAEWCDTGLRVQQGQRISIGAQGQWGYLREPAYGPAGARQRIDNSLYPRAPLAALLGRVGERIFPIGQGGEFEMPSDGVLHLSMNDVSGSFQDNSGHMDVYVRETATQ